jgi:hypothetical protein
MAALGVFSMPVLAADWQPVTQVGGHSREIDMSSIKGQAPMFTYASRHVFHDLEEYRIGKRGIKFLVISSRANCQFRTTARLGVDAYDENMTLISRQLIQNPEESTVLPDSIEEATLKIVCQAR